MSVHRSDVPSRSTAARVARYGARGTAVGATIAFVLAGTIVPAAAQPAYTDPCGPPTSLGVITCVYDNPDVTDYALRVPAGVGEVRVEARGGAGGDGGTVNSRIPAPQGGHGGYVSASFPVVPDDLLRVQVGGRGQDADGMAPGAGGRNGGAKGGGGATAGGGGGGATTVRLNGADETARILVAGGGGGAGGAMDSTGYWTGRGGAGGGERGADGYGNDTAKGGVGAVGPSGGAGLKRLTGLDGHSGYDADHGGGGGEGGYGTSPKCISHSGTVAFPVGAGGGGGGYAGGGGGAAGATIGGGGGGGSGFVATSFLAPAVATLGSTEFAMGAGSQRDGEVVITYRLPADRHGHATAVSAPARFAAETSTGRGVADRS
jgi:hypothetical protein